LIDFWRDATPAAASPAARVFFCFPGERRDGLFADLTRD